MAQAKLLELPESKSTPSTPESPPKPARDAPPRSDGDARIDAPPEEARPPLANFGRLDQHRHRITRLLCARCYFFGLWVSVPTLHRLLGPALSANDVPIGCDKERVLFHALQSFLLSLCFLVPGVVLLYAPAAFAATMLVPYATLLVFKTAILNPWLARARFASSRHLPELRIPMLGRIADLLKGVLVSRVSNPDQNVVYFKGERPFVGFGSEINAWTLVIDTSAPAHSVETIVGQQQAPALLSLDALYESIRARVGGLGLENVNLCRGTFVSGEFGDSVSPPVDTRYRRPSVQLSPESLHELDREGNRGREYLALVSANPDQDLVVSQMIRFQRNGKLLFGEFASHVIPPGKKRLYRLDRYFDTNWLVFQLIGAIVLILAALASVALSPFVEGLLYLATPWFFAPGVVFGGFFDAEYMLDVFGVNAYPYVADQLINGWFVYRIVALSMMLIAAFALWRLIVWLLTLLGVFLGVRRQYGRAESFREQVGKGAALEYYELQSVVCFLKSQEKVLVGAIADVLTAHGIDTSDIKDNIVAFINQGVVNSGEIRGNVATKIKSIAFRRSNRRRGVKAGGKG